MDGLREIAEDDPHQATQRVGFRPSSPGHFPDLHRDGHPGRGEWRLLAVGTTFSSRT